MGGGINIRVKVIVKGDTFFSPEMDKLFFYEKKCSFLPLVLGLGVYLPQFWVWYANTPHIKNQNVNLYPLVRLY